MPIYFRYHHDHRYLEVRYEGKILPGELTTAWLNAEDGEKE